jgi:hypothetical protein
MARRRAVLTYHEINDVARGHALRADRDKAAGKPPGFRTAAGCFYG